MKRPSFQFYPGDWQVNSNLRRCSHAEKGVWLDILCLLHDAPDYGVLRWPLKEIAQAVGATPATVKGLVTKGVLKGDDKRLVEPYTYTPRSGRKDGETVTLLDTQDGPIWYSSRMVKDEYVRTIRGENTRFSDGNDAPLKPAPKPPFGEGKSASPKPPFGDGSSSSSSSSSSNKQHTVVDQPPGEPDGSGSVCVFVCQKMQEVGIGDANASDAGLAVLVGKGVDPGVFVDAAKVAVGQGKGFAYALGVVKNKTMAAAALEAAPLAAPAAAAVPVGRVDISRVTVPAKPDADAELRRLAADAAIPRTGPSAEVKARLAELRGAGGAGGAAVAAGAAVGVGV